MTLVEYNKKMKEYENKLSLFRMDQLLWEDLYWEMTKFQEEYMENVLSEYQKTIDCEARQHVYSLLEYAVRQSISGNAIITVETKEVADEVENYLGEIGEYLLDWQVYEWKGKWEVDCMFGGNYVPQWYGWDEC